MIAELRLPLLLCLGLAACAPHGPDLAAAGVVPGGAPAVSEHTLSPGDSFEIRFPFDEDYNDRVTVGADGTVAPKAVGSVKLGGLTADEARKVLQERYAKFLRAPELSITLRTYAPEIVYVDGWVNRPGLLRSDMPLTVARALAQAGGAKTGAITDDILIIRSDAAGKAQAYRVALGDFAGIGAQDPLLKSFDVVYVPQTTIVSVADFLGRYGRNIPFSFSYSPAATRPTPTPAQRPPAATTTIVR